MGRTTNQFGKLWRDLFRRDEFCAKPLLDKVMFVLLITPDECDHAGLGRITSRRWMKALAPATEDEIEAAMHRLEKAGDVYFDRDTEEFFVREFMMRDRIGAVPLTMVSAAKSAAAVASPKLAAALRTEIMRLDIHTPKLARMELQLDAALLAADEHCRALAGDLEVPAAAACPTTHVPADPIGNPIPDPITDGILPAPESGVETPVSDPIPDGIADGSVVVEVEFVRSPTSLPATSKRNHSRRPSNLPTAPEPAQPSPDPDQDPEPPPAPTTCGPQCRSVPCGRCADAATDRRHQAETAAADAARAAAAAAAAARATIRADIDKCGLCDRRTGTLPSGQKCDHVDRTAIHARGRAAAWASIGGRKPIADYAKSRRARSRRFGPPREPLAATG